MSQHESAPGAIPEVQLSEDELEQVSGGTLQAVNDTIEKAVATVVVTVTTPILNALID